MKKNVNRREALKMAGTLGLVPFIPNLQFDQEKELSLPLLNDITSVLLQNQRIFNNAYDCKMQIDTLLKKHSIPIIRKLVNNMASPKLFGVQPLLNSEGLIHYLEFIEDKIDPTLITLVIDSEAVKCKQQEKNIGLSSVLSKAGYNLPDSEIECFIDVVAGGLAIDIDVENITNILNNVGTISSWDFNTTMGYTIKEKYESIYVKIAEISNIIYRKTLRGANWIVTSPEIASIFETAPLGFEANPNEDECSLGTVFAGTIDNRWKLYKSTHTPSIQNKILIGYKGNSHLDSGYFYCPHLIFSDYSKRYITSDYTSCFVPKGNDFYAVINVNNIF